MTEPTRTAKARAVIISALLEREASCLLLGEKFDPIHELDAIRRSDIFYRQYDRLGERKRWVYTAWLKAIKEIKRSSLFYSPSEMSRLHWHDSPLCESPGQLPLFDLEPIE